MFVIVYLSFSSAFYPSQPCRKKKVSCGRAWSGEVVSPAIAAIGLYFVCLLKFRPAGFHFVFYCGFARQCFFKEPEKKCENTCYPFYKAFNEVRKKKNAFMGVGEATA